MLRGPSVGRAAAAAFSALPIGVYPDAVMPWTWAPRAVASSGPTGASVVMSGQPAAFSASVLPVCVP